MEENTYPHATPPNAPPKNPCKTLQKRRNLGMHRISSNHRDPLRNLMKTVWNRMEEDTYLHATPPNAPSQKTLVKPCKNKEIWGSIQSHGIPWNLVKTYGNHMESHGGKHIPPRDTSQRPCKPLQKTKTTGDWWYLMGYRETLWNLMKTIWNRMEENTYPHATPPTAPPKNHCKTLQKQSNLGIDRISWNPVKPCETLWKPHRIAFGRGWNCRKPYNTCVKSPKLRKGFLSITNFGGVHS